MTALATRVDLREVMQLALDLFREHGYLRHQFVYNCLLNRYGTFLFRNIGFVKQMETFLSVEFRVPHHWVKVILQRWFEDRALIVAGFRDLVDNDDDRWF